MKAQEFVEKLKMTSVEDLHIGLSTDKEKLSFWINVYNAYIHVILDKHPELYEDRRSFFKTPYIALKDITLSFAEIEHGIIRRSQYEYFLGYLSKFFPPAFERKLRVSKRDPRIHFALNCGAKSCPPVIIYDAQHIDEQLDRSARRYLHKHTNYNKSEEKYYTTTLFSWFRGGFGGPDGIRDMLIKYGAIAPVTWASIHPVTSF